MSSSNSANNTPSAFDAEDDKPLWKYVTRLEKSGAKGGNYTFQCNFCRVTRKGSYTRVRAHLMQIKNQGIEVCPKVTSKDKADFERAIAEAELKLKNSRLKKVPLPPPSSSASLGLCFNEPEDIYGSKRKRSTALGSGSSSNPVMKAFNIGARERLNSEIARMFYSAGLPFHLARNPYYVSAFTFAANNNIQGYVPPGYNMLRTTLLQKERINIDRLLDPIRGSWREKGVSIVSDGWSDSQRRPLINFMAVTGGGPMFLKAVDCSGETKDKYFISLDEPEMEVVLFTDDGGANEEKGGDANDDEDVQEIGST